MADGGKGSRARPLSVPREQYDAAFDMIFQASKQCGLCNMKKAVCGCQPTNDGPGQEMSEEQQHECSKQEN